MEVSRELDLINKHIRHHHETAGESVVWFEFLSLASGGSTYDDIYDEGDTTGNGRNYAPGIEIPTVYVEEIEDENRAIEEGRQPTQNVKLTIAIKDMIEAGVTSPHEYQPHLNDMFLYDGRYFSVYRYQARGRLRNEVLVAVEGVETYAEQEFVYDVAPNYSPSTTLPWPTTLPKVV